VNADLPRFDYDPSTLAPKGLLVEETRTNTFLQSRSLANAAWVKIQSSVVATTTVSPWGTANAEKLTENTATAARYMRQDSVATTSGALTSISYLVQAAGRNYIALLEPNASGGSRGRYFDITPGTNGAVLGTLDGTPNASFITKFGDWFLCTIVVTSGASAGPRIYLSPDGASISYTGDGSSGVYVSDPQHEVGAFPTSRIPTEATAVTRNADVATMTGTNFSDWFNATEGTFVGSLENNSANTNTLLAATDGTTTTFMQMTESSQNVPRFVANIAGSVQAAIVRASSANPYVFAASYKQDNFQFCVNGVAGTADTSGNVPTVDRLLIGAAGQSATWYSNGVIKSIRYYPQQLTANELQSFSKG
jgi:hypothetical protein